MVLDLSQFDEEFDMDDMMLDYYNLDLSHPFSFDFLHI
jgi:hypothetical protein